MHDPQRKGADDFGMGIALAYGPACESRPLVKRTRSLVLGRRAERTADCRCATDVFKAGPEDDDAPPTWKVGISE